MKTLTVKQPWASLIVNGIKDIENRTWPTKYRGRVLIHAGSQPFAGIKQDGCITHLFTNEQYKTLLHKRIDIWLSSGYISGKLSYPLGAIIGSVEIVDCVINHPSIWAEKTFYDDFENTKPIYNWVLANPVIFDTPILAKGKQSFWDYIGINDKRCDDEYFCNCQIPVKEVNQVISMGHGIYKCRYCGGQWYK